MSHDTPKDDRPKTESGLREVSPEEFRRMQESGQTEQTAWKPPHATRYRYNKSVLATAAIVIISLAVGFFFGVDYQKTRNTSANTTASNSTVNPNSVNGRRGARRAGAIGQVTAVSSTSISVQNQRTGADQTFKITSSTTVSNNGSSASVSDIKTGDTVLVRTSSSDTSTATSILINPSFGGPGGFNGPSQSDDGSTNSISTPAPSTIDTTGGSTI